MLPRAGTVKSYALYKSRPAALVDPRVGIIAFSVNRTTRIFGDDIVI